MAGDWIKMQTCLPDKPEVWQIASIVGIDPDAVIGKLLRVWAWFDTHTEDGNAVGVTFSLVDRIAGVTGFAEAMSLCGWLEQRDINLTLPKFCRHNGSSAKTRALTNDRVAKTRSNKGKSNGECNADTVTKTVTREEKRREEETLSAMRFNGFSWLTSHGVSPEVANGWLAVRKLKKQACTEIAFSLAKKEAEKAKLSLNDALTISVQKSWAGFNSKWLDEETSPPEVWAANLTAGAI